MTDFLLIRGRMGWWDVVYPGEKKPRYMINSKDHTCICEGNTNGLICKHLKELDNV